MEYSLWALNKDTNYNTNFLTGKKISNISLEYFDENKFYKEEDLKKNNYTLINFWASWCSTMQTGTSATYATI